MEKTKKQRRQSARKRKRRRRDIQKDRLQDMSETNKRDYVRVKPR